MEEHWVGHRHVHVWNGICQRDNGLMLGALSVTHNKEKFKLDFPAFDWPVVPFPQLQYPHEQYSQENIEEEARCLELVGSTY